MTASQVHQTKIEGIDAEIYANRRVLLRRVRFAPSTASEWQAAWDRSPDLWARNNGLYLQRGIEQDARDKAAHREWQSEQRRLHAPSRRKAA